MRILLVEDEPDLGEILQRTLTREKYIVDWLTNGNAAWNILEGKTIDYVVLILDWLLPGLSGIDLCQRLRNQGDNTPILILTAKDQIEDKVVGLDAGADDYLIKPFSNAELLARLRSLQRRSPHLHPQTLEVGSFCLNYGTFTITSNHPGANRQPIPLTAKEFQLLEYFMQHPNQILKREQLMDQVWPLQADPSSNVVPAQIRLLRRKLSDYGCGDPIETIHGIGYCLRIRHES